MSQPAICVQGLSKCYQIGGPRERYRTLREAISQAVATPIRRLNYRERSARQAKTFWALRDVHFEVPRGEVLGIIGRNGAGKSTLLKILTRITSPTRGRIVINGRVASLLEVGTGFHPELTGRENIYLNGSLLGLKRWEINQRFDAIVDFAEVEEFLDTPVKRYSSGMCVRLAFAVAAHLTPEVLLLDEVLALGDADFQRKCMGSVESVTKSGRTVLLVSHDLTLIESLCSSAILLDKGTITTGGSTAGVVAAYLERSRSSTPFDLTQAREPNANSTARFTGIRVRNRDRTTGGDIPSGGCIIFELGIAAQCPIRRPCVGISVRTPLGHLVCWLGNREAGYHLSPLIGNCHIVCSVESPNLLPGRYHVDLELCDVLGNQYDFISSAAFFDVRKADTLGTGMPMGGDYGLIFLPSEWNATTDAVARPEENHPMASTRCGVQKQKDPF